MFAKVFDSFDPSRVHNWGPPGLWGTGELAIFINGNMRTLLKGTWEQSGFRGTIWNFF